eukprot:COSAG01_NODE_8585_length_2728_cov_14.207684_3_plen_63_part_00
MVISVTVSTDNPRLRPRYGTTDEGGTRGCLALEGYLRFYADACRNQAGLVCESIARMQQRQR